MWSYFIVLFPTYYSALHHPIIGILYLVSIKCMLQPREPRTWLPDSDHDFLAYFNVQEIMTNIMTVLLLFYLFSLQSHQIPWNISANIQVFVEFLLFTTIEFCMCRIFLWIAVAFSAFYFSICSYLQSFIDDLARICDRSDENMPKRQFVSEKQSLVRFIQFHLQCYRYVLC